MRINQEALLNAKILVVGDVMLDRYWYGSVERISPEAPVPIVQVDKEEDRIGAAANVAYNIVSLGAKASLLSVIGDDSVGRELQQLIVNSGIEAFLHFDQEMKTTVKLRVIGRHQQLIRIDFESPPQKEVLASLTDLFTQLLPQQDCILFSDYGKGGLAHISTMIGLAKSANKTVLVDPKGKDYSKYAGADLITPNKSELIAVIGNWKTEQELSEKAQNLRQSLQLKNLLLTRSEEGMTLFDEQGTMHIAAQAREVFDVTGAGDTVIATLASLVGSGISIREAVPLANKAGGIVVGKFGTATISYEELFA
jgi:rfaE bifunctional protein kinase chain/domain